jgi:L-ascorbate oxidase
MQTAWVFGNASEITTIPHILAQGYLTFGGNAYGNKSVDPIAYHYFEQHPQNPWEKKA